ncbi:MAG: 4-hydroxy-tetrahydrodipicolinate reductase [Actinomycetota bacterium]|nr:4-hydroxy-tetrahydrodipicolinate reductase [Actinomycetota bacterium]MDI6822079.1 4-hydroxy-tetrahydrodipicolinate reductase [Actinomycetota bacterium]
MIKIVVTGAAGKMGREVCKTVLQQKDMTLVGAVDIVHVGCDVGKLLGLADTGIAIDNDLERVFKETSPDVMVDFTHPAAVMNNIRSALKSNVHVVVGTTGLTERDLTEVESLVKDGKTNAIIAPNFATGAVLMMKFSEIACKYFPDVEIIELHHNQKADAPSGTALKTAEIISQAKVGEASRNPKETEKIKGVRGGEAKGIRIHSVRLPGLVAHQQVIFGSTGQILSIKHDSIDRSSFMPGVLMAIREVQKRRGLTYGLDKLLEI